MREEEKGEYNTAVTIQPSVKRRLRDIQSHRNLYIQTPQEQPFTHQSSRSSLSFGFDTLYRFMYQLKRVGYASNGNAFLRHQLLKQSIPSEWIGSVEGRTKQVHNTILLELLLNLYLILYRYLYLGNQLSSILYSSYIFYYFQNQDFKRGRAYQIYIITISIIPLISKRL